MFKRVLSIWGALHRTVRFIGSHPLTKRRLLRACWRYASWQLYGRFQRHPTTIPFINGSRLSIPASAHVLTGYLYVGLPDFEDAAFALHMLRPGDRFFDVGANAGAWTVMATAVGAAVDAFEPIASSLQLLERNVALNDATARVHIHAAGVGSQAGSLHFTTDNGTSNRVMSDEELGRKDCVQTLEVPVVTLDLSCAESVPTLVKIDVEGWELEVVKGSTKLLKNPALLGLIVETFRHSRMADPSLQELENVIGSYGFEPSKYDPQTRTLELLGSGSGHSANTLYVRHLPIVKERLKSAAPFSILGQRV